MGLFGRRSFDQGGSATTAVPDVELHTLVEELDANLARVSAQRDQARHDLRELEQQVRTLSAELEMQGRRLAALRSGRGAAGAATVPRPNPGLWTLVEEDDGEPARSRYRASFSIIGTIAQLDNLDFLLRLMASAGARASTVFVDLLIDGGTASPLEVIRDGTRIGLDEIETETWLRAASEGGAATPTPMDPEAEAAHLEYASAPAARVGAAGASIELDFR